MTRPRRTLARATALLEGVGLHSGADASVRVRPAPAGAGIVLRDEGTGQEIPARAANVVDTSRCTVLGAGAARVSTVEHLLSALAGLGVDDAVIETRGAEIPAADGSALPFVALLREAGLRDQEGPEVAPLRPDRPRLVTGERGETVVALPAPAFRATVVLDYPDHAFIGTQAAAYDAADPDGAGYESQVAPARTFGFLREVEWLRAQGLARGASYENALVLREDGYETPPRLPDELARHKLLDLIGDLALVGRPLAAEVIAVKPGHALNARLARLLAGGG